MVVCEKGREWEIRRAGQGRAGKNVGEGGDERERETEAPRTAVGSLTEYAMYPPGLLLLLRQSLPPLPSRSAEDTLPSTIPSREWNV